MRLKRFLLERNGCQYKAHSQICKMFLFNLLFLRAGHLPLDKALDLIGYLQQEKHTVPLLQGLGYLEAFYHMIEKRDEPSLTHNLGVRNTTSNFLWFFFFGTKLPSFRFFVCLCAEVHPALFSCPHRPADVEWQRHCVRATPKVRGLVTGLSPGPPSLSGACKSSL